MQGFGGSEHSTGEPGQGLVTGDDRLPEIEGTDREYVAGDVTMKLTEFAGPTSRTFVLVHGIGMGRIVFTEFAKTLSPHGRVLAMDLPGFGDSPESPSAQTLEETAVVVADFIERETTGQVVLVGHSMGTQIVAEIALHRPSLIERLVLIAPTINRHERTVIKQSARMLQDLSTESAKVLIIGVWEYLKTNPRWFAEKLEFMMHHQLELVAPQLTVPTLVLRGETDKVCPRGWVSEIAGLIPNGVMREIPERGHGAMIETPEPTASLVLEFLTAQR